MSDEKHADADTENETNHFQITGRNQIRSVLYIAVANIPDLLENQVYSEAIQTVNGLKSISLI